MSKIPTVEEWLNKHALECIEKNCADINELKCIMIHFAREHVEAALKESSKKVKLIKKEMKYTGVRAGGSYFTDIIDKNSILNAYPLENVK